MLKKPFYLNQPRQSEPPVHRPASPDQTARELECLHVPHQMNCSTVETKGPQWTEQRRRHSDYAGRAVGEWHTSEAQRKEKERQWIGMKGEHSHQTKILESTR